MNLPRHSTRAFTLLEILLVVLVIAIAVGAVVPLTIEAIEGVRLRSAIREVIAINRYARARALLDKRPVAVLYDREGGVVELVQLPSRAEVAAEGFVDLPPLRLEESGRPSDAVESIRKRKLASFVTVDSIEGLPEESGTWYAVYTPGGLCDPHRIVLRDNRGDTMTLRVNGFTGDISVGDAP
jgi:prepilin-type N-terminal cleavage/methylation domain-containing protein